MKSLSKSDVEIISNPSESRYIHGGISDKVIAKVDGIKVMLKEADSNMRETYCEYMASRLGELIGLSVNEVEIVKDCPTELTKLDDICSMHIWEESFRPRSKVYNDDYLLEYNLSKEQLYEDKQLIKMFDKIIDNEDRHDNNWGYVNGNLFLIDHETSYPWFELTSTDKKNIIFDIENNMSKKMYKLLTNFYYLDVEDFYEAFITADEVLDKVSDSNIVDKMISRMLDIQDIIGEKLRLKQLVA